MSDESPFGATIEPTMPEPQTDLDRLCLHFGIACGFTDVWKTYHPASEATKLALLRAMGLELHEAGQAGAALSRFEEAQWRDILPPVLVVFQGEGPPRLTCTLSLNNHPATLTWQLKLESGKHVTGQWRQGMTPLETRQFGARHYARHVFELPGEFPLGYHEFVLCYPAETRKPLAKTRIIVCPKKCFEFDEESVATSRVWGIATQLYALRSARNWGMGDFSDLAALGAQAGALGAAIVGVNPLHAMFIHNPGASSPYSPSNRTALNVLYLDVEAIADFEESPEAKHRVDSDAFRNKLRVLRETELVDYLGVAPAKLEILELLYDNFRRQHLARNSERAKAFRSFQAAAGEALRLHAVFDALQEHFHRQDASIWGWPVWPDAYRSPTSVAVEMFTQAHAERVDYYAYLQWQADIQLGEAAARARAAKLSIGLYRDLAVGANSAGAETWIRPAMHATSVRIGAPPDEINSIGQDWGLPPLIPAALYRSAFESFVELLRTNMRHAGALRIDHVMGLFRLYWVPPGGTPRDGTYVLYPFREMMGILALESRRNGCLVIGEDLGTVPPEVNEAMASFGVLSYRPLYFERDEDGGFKAPEHYPERALVTAGTHDLPTLSGFWSGADLRVRKAHELFGSEAMREAQWMGRAEDRKRLLAALEHAGYLAIPGAGAAEPNGFDERIALAVHAFLASTPSRIMMVQIEDVLGQVDQVNVPGTSDEQHPNWRRKLFLPLEAWSEDARVRDTTLALNAERGAGAVTSAASGSETVLTIPRASYRLQFNRDFGFLQAAELVAYFEELGISHIYASPFFKARPGSQHGYDVTDHNAFNPEIGSAEDFEHFCRALREHHLRLMLDLVPNHMGIMGSDNLWWLDVLESGRASRYADFFDIHWEPLSEDLQGKVLLPVLGDQYGKVLEQGEIKLRFDAETGSFSLMYHEHRFPIDPGEYPRIIGIGLSGRAEHQAEASLQRELEELSAAFMALPRRDESVAARIELRRKNIPGLKKRLARLSHDRADVRAFITSSLKVLNGSAGEAASFDRLHALIKAQAFRLSYWRVAAHDVNYRRFFDINELAALRMERPEVFNETHRLALRLVREGKASALRIDHPDGLYDPQSYFERLQASITGRAVAARQPGDALKRRIYLVLEKILGEHEHLPSNWPVHGTTGYRFVNVLNGLFVDVSAEAKLSKVYATFMGEAIDFDDLLFNAKTLIMNNSLASDLNVLANMLNRIAKSDRNTCDFTLESLRRTLRDVVACFPVYRTYATSKGLSEGDRRHVDWAIALAKRRSRATELSVFDFLRAALTRSLQPGKPQERERLDRFVGRFQQYTAPVMAKAMEDTCFYHYNRLVSLNEVGGDPRTFGISLHAFHTASRDRARQWPHTMLASSTHDNKRSEDVRARINVLSEIPGLWRLWLRRWRTINRRKQRIESDLAPSRNDEYLLYQILLGTWPLERVDQAALDAYRGRIQRYMLKAVREAKAHTSWISPNEEYEAALAEFIEKLLGSLQGNRFIHDFLPAQAVVSRYGMLNGVAQMLVKFASPGVPDIYQGNEMWDFSLVDPDNRRAVDYQKRMTALRALAEEFGGSEADRADKARSLVETMADGRIKLYVIWRALSLRAREEALFEHGDYLPLAATGAKAAHVCAFARIHQRGALIAAAPRLIYQLTGGTGDAPLGPEVWKDTCIPLPDIGREWRDELTGRQHSAEVVNGVPSLPLASLLTHFPAALLRPMLSA